MIDLSCSCGAVRLSVSVRPDYLHACNCSLCAPTGAWWGYPHPDRVSVSGETRVRGRSDRPAMAEVHSCAACGDTTHFVLSAAAIAAHGNGMMGVNLRLAGEPALDGIELRFPDGAAWDGQSAFGYVREPRVIGAAR